MIVRKKCPPILLVLYKRKRTTLRVMEAISKVRPSRIYLSQDGPKNSRELQEILDVRQAVLKKINWDCKLTTYFHKTNLGLKKHVPLAIKSFLSAEEHGIYLEDDTVPNKDFFYFMTETLTLFKEDNSIFGISGCNLFKKSVNCDEDFYLSKIPNIWGAGLYRRSWKLYDPDMRGYKKKSKKKEFQRYFPNLKFRYWANVFFKAVKSGKINTWDFQVLYTMAKHNMYFVNSSKNFVKNIGFSNSSTNSFLSDYKTRYDRFVRIKTSNKDLKYNSKYDEIYFNNLLRGGILRIFMINSYLYLPKVFQSTINLILEKIKSEKS